MGGSVTKYLRGMKSVERAISFYRSNVERRVARAGRCRLSVVAKGTFLRLGTSQKRVAVSHFSPSKFCLPNAPTDYSDIKVYNVIALLL